MIRFLAHLLAILLLAAGSTGGMVGGLRAPCSPEPTLAADVPADTAGCCGDGTQFATADAGCCCSSPASTSPAAPAACAAPYDTCGCGVLAPWPRESPARPAERIQLTSRSAPAILPAIHCRPLITVMGSPRTWLAQRSHAPPAPRRDVICRWKV
ncbi:MAG: hypothetical protein IT435_03865 [Phycisphaerales bacterium]|nr:hypothetical protein [Phycisphaerales bacterium]